MTVANYILNVVNEYIDYALRTSNNVEELNEIFINNNVPDGGIIQIMSLYLPASLEEISYDLFM